MDTRITPLKVKGLIAPVMRPMPTIFTYARLTARSRGLTADALDEEFNTNLTALVEIIEKAGRDSGMAPEAWHRVQQSCINLAPLQGEDLAAALDGFCAELTRWHKDQKENLQGVVKNQADQYRQLYREITRPKKLLVCYSEGLQHQSDSLERKLVERCYYDSEVVANDWGEAQRGSADVVLFAPSLKPIPDNLLARAESYGMPILILMGVDKSQDMQNMALMKSEFLYRRSGHNVLHSPFTPARLYCSIDAIYLRHLSAKVVQLPQYAKKAAQAAREAAAGQD